MAIVGARAATRAALDTAAALARAVASDGGLVVSGGALGVDGAAHRGALAGHGTTWVVLGTGVDVAYPDRHAALFGAVVDGGGALLSCFPRGTPPRPWQFVHRNAVIAALADAVVVVEARPRSGALHTVAAARRLGRAVAAVPGSPGCEALIADGAAPVAGPAELTEVLAGRPPRRAVALPAAGTDAARVLAALRTDQPRDVEELAARTGLSLRATGRAVTDLELRGLARLQPGQTYLRSALAASAA